MTQPLKIGVLGSGPAGQTLAAGLLEKGHPVLIGSRDPAKLVKSFNVVQADVMINPSLTGDEPDMFIAGNDSEASRR